MTKMHGNGNDYIYYRPAPGEDRDWADVSRRISDRHFGLGSDGLILALPSSRADLMMRMFNADGSEAEMCGNGIRCVAKLLYETDPALRRPTLRIETGAGVLELNMDVDGGRVRAIDVDMGRPRLTRDEIPILPQGATRVLREPISARGRTFHLTAVSMGNPHAVMFMDDPASLRPLAEEFGPLFETAERFPRRTNVEFAYVRPSGEIDLVVWERGSGITLACGTGACATVVAACLEERLAPGVNTVVHLPGGPLTITVEKDYSTVHMRGPARSLFDATIDVARLMSR